MDDMDYGTFEADKIDNVLIFTKMHGTIDILFVLSILASIVFFIFDYSINKRLDEKYICSILGGTVCIWFVVRMIACYITDEDNRTCLYLEDN